jgi:hypothetical protein
MTPQPIETDGSPETVTAVATTSSPSAAPSNMLSVVQVRRNSGNHADVGIDRVAVGPVCHTQHSVAPDSHHPTNVPYSSVTRATSQASHNVVITSVVFKSVLHSALNVSV